MTYRIKITGTDFNKLRELVCANAPRETGAFALAGLARQKDGFDIIIRRILPIPESLFRVQTRSHLEISSQAVNGLASLCEQNGLGAVLCHFHPYESAYSPSDDFGEERIFRTLEPFITSNSPMASLLFSPKNIQGRIWMPKKGRFVLLDSVEVVGRYLQHMAISDGCPHLCISDKEMFDRQIRAFGEAGQTMISTTKVGIVGLGGTGSAVAEQVIRMGVKDFVLVDPDRIDLSNITRVYGSFPDLFRMGFWRSVRRRPLKVNVAINHMLKINPQARIVPYALNIVQEDAARALLDRDIIFLCTDDHWGRSVVNQIAYQYLIPVINLGIAIGSTNGEVMTGAGVIDILRPGKPCLWCSGFLRAEVIEAESIPQALREGLAREGYVEGLETRTPSVISMTTTIAGMATTQFLQIVTDFMRESGDVTRLNYNPLDGTVHRGKTGSRDNCICKKVQGFGDLKPLNTINHLSLFN
jgi:hypothetical protein